MFRMLALLLCVLTVHPLHAGGPWPAGTGHGYLKLGQRLISARYFFNLDGDVIPITTTRVWTSSLYAEYGLSERLTLKAYAPFFFRTTLNEVRYLQSGRIEPGDALSSFGDSDLGVSYALIKDKLFVLGTTVMLGLPLGNPGGGETGLLQSGDGEFNQLVKLEAGYSFYPKPVFINGSLGFNHRTRGFSEEFHAGFDAGIMLKDRVTLIFKSYLVRSFRNGSAPAAGTGLFSNNIQYLSFGPEVNVRLGKHLGLSGGVYGAQAATNVLAAPSFDLGVFAKF